MLEYTAELSSRLHGGGLPPLDANNNPHHDKYSLRPRSSRRRAASPRPPKPKAAPLSKYRRKNANARERSRMREINEAFETLRRAVPQVAASVQTNEKLTKITTLRLAMKYIATLSATLSSSEELAVDCGASSGGELDFFLESDGLQSDFSDDFSNDFEMMPGDFGSLSPDLDEQLITHFDPFLAGLS